MYHTKLGRRIVPVLASLILLVSLTTVASAYDPYSVVFAGAIDATTRWGSPVTTGPSSYPTVTSKWNEARGGDGTSPHIGVDLGVGANYEVAAVTNGTLVKASDGTTWNTHSLSTPKSGVYCHYEHMLKIRWLTASLTVRRLCIGIQPRGITAGTWIHSVLLDGTIGELQVLFSPLAG